MAKKLTLLEIMNEHKKHFAEIEENDGGEWLCDAWAKEEKRLKGKILYRTRNDTFFCKKMQYYRRDEVIRFFNEHGLFYEIDTEDMTYEKAKYWLWHMSKKIWVQQNGKLIFALQSMLRDVINIQEDRKKKCK